MTLLNYADFLFESYNFQHEQASKENLLLVCAEKSGASIDEMESLRFFIVEGFVNELFEISSSLDENSFADKFKQLAIDAKEKLKEKGKEYADKLGNKAEAALKFGGNILAPLKAVLQKVMAIIKKGYDLAKEFAANAIEKTKDKISDKLKGLLKDSDKRKKITEELKNMKAIAEAGVKWGTGGFVEALAKTGVSAATTDESFGYSKAFESAFYYAVAEVLQEGYSVKDALAEMEIFESEHGGTGGIHIPFISSIMSKITKMPPFSQFHHIEHKVAGAAAAGLNKYSIIMTKIADAPGPFEFPVLASIVGIGIGEIAFAQFSSSLENLAELAKESLGFMIPGFGTVMMILKYAAMSLAVYALVQELVGGEGKEEPAKEKGDEKEEPAK